MSDHLDILPVSVIDIAPQKKRRDGDHANRSSRSEFSPFPEAFGISDEMEKKFVEAWAWKYEAKKGK